MMNKKYHTDETFLARWLQNELTDEERVSFEKDADYKLFEQLKYTSNQISIPDFQRDVVFQKIQEKIQSKSQPKVRKLVPNWAYAVAAAVVILLGITVFLPNNTTITTGIGEQLAYTLPDGSTVNLNANSTLEFNKKAWEKGNKTLELDGEGFFKVAKGQKFKVNTAHGSVAVLGTEFNVNSLDGYFDVRCYEGKVAVKNLNNNDVLTAGKTYTSIKNKGVTRGTLTKTKPTWLQGHIELNGTPLTVVLKIIENHYEVHFKTDAIDTSVLYTGMFPMDDLEFTLKTVFLPLHVRYDIQGETIVLADLE